MLSNGCGTKRVDDVLMLIWSGTNNAVWLSYTNQNSILELVMSGSTAMTFDTTNSYDLNQWHHVAVVNIVTILQKFMLTG